MNKCENAPVLGIMACETQGQPPFPEKNFFAQLVGCGAKFGLFVFVFSPSAVDFGAKKVDGYTRDDPAGEWRFGRFPLPDILFDRSFPQNAAARRKAASVRRRLLSEVHAVPLGAALTGKWPVYLALRRHDMLLPYLPDTERLHDNERLAGWLDRKGRAFLKPLNATHGKGTLYAEKLDDSRYLVKGRRQTNTAVEAVLDGREALADWLDGFREGRSYLIQDYLPLSAANGNAFDVRALMQKNGDGRWTLTGLAVREGSPGSMTSNLHGGGKAAEAVSFLRAEFGVSHGDAIAAELSRVAAVLAAVLERHFGRLAEVGIDMGVDRTGRVWVIEANSKPGRRAFAAFGDPETGRSAVIRPVAYARYLARTRLKKFHEGSGGHLNEL